VVGHRTHHHRIHSAHSTHHCPHSPALQETVSVFLHVFHNAGLYFAERVAYIRSGGRAFNFQLGRYQIVTTMTGDYGHVTPPRSVRKAGDT